MYLSSSVACPTGNGQEKVHDAFAALGSKHVDY